MQKHMYWLLKNFNAVKVTMFAGFSFNSIFVMTERKTWKLIIRNLEWRVLQRASCCLLHLCGQNSINSTKFKLVPLSHFSKKTVCASVNAHSSSLAF